MFNSRRSPTHRYLEPGRGIASIGSFLQIFIAIVLAALLLFAKKTYDKYKRNKKNFGKQS